MALLLAVLGSNLFNTEESEKCYATDCPKHDDVILVAPADPQSPYLAENALSGSCSH